MTPPTAAIIVPKPPRLPSADHFGSQSLCIPCQAMLSYHRKRLLCRAGIDFVEDELRQSLSHGRICPSSWSQTPESASFLVPGLALLEPQQHLNPRLSRGQRCKCPMCVCVSFIRGTPRMVVFLLMSIQNQPNTGSPKRRQTHVSPRLEPFGNDTPDISFSDESGVSYPKKWICTLGICV